ncbi:GYD domain-containing protein [Limibaculum sp. M0105]|uniref:GYD domain-containing protein n=1 Tax=Thermohalobaculum xanthum TaxID=2753746 RepID=A0A8J7M5F7_9RHOB|nr:GYD domain-containing protein [Thermohalobaculum xanthum]MBK0398545.1 GYD domain-containing protein [Thermohalobaculum xanthum]
MATFLLQFSYSSASTKALIDKPQNRRKLTEKMISSAGGSVKEMYFCFGDFDGLAICEFPSNVEAASVALAVGASGACSKFKTTVLMTMEESQEAMKKAGKVRKAYSPPTA